MHGKYLKGLVYAKHVFRFAIGEPDNPYKLKVEI
jgi:hypothetical protein